MNKAKNIFLRFIFLLIALGSCFLFLLSDRYVIPILNYHNIDDAPGEKALWVSSSHFDYQMAYLKKNGYHVISLSALIDGIERHIALPKKSVVITFDDGYENNYTQAYPILKKYGYPAIIFLVSDWIDRDGYLTTWQIKEMSRHGISFGSHTQTHPFLPNITEDKKRIEIAGSKVILEKKLGLKMDFLAYPFGGFKQNGSSKTITDRKSVV